MTARSWASKGWRSAVTMERLSAATSAHTLVEAWGVAWAGASVCVSATAWVLVRSGKPSEQQTPLEWGPQWALLSA